MNIRIVSPSGAIEQDWVEGAKQRLLSIGWQVTEGGYARCRYGRFAATDEQRLQDLNAALEDESVDAVLCSRGGYGLQRIVDRVARITKPVVGFSDITELHQLAGLNCTPSLHAVMCKHMAVCSQDDEVFGTTVSALCGEPLHYTLPAHPLNRAGCVTGMLTGGNLSVLYGLQGTPYSLSAVFEALERKNQKGVLFLEDIGERHYHIDRMMNNLRLSGVLAHISGLVVGQFSDCEDDRSMNETVYETIARYVSRYDYPVLFGFPAGHVERNMPLWLNSPASLTVTAMGGTLGQDGYFFS